MTRTPAPYPERLARELHAAGIRGSLRERIVGEFEDHLECDPAAMLGEPAAIARQFADELGTRRALRAGFTAFTALAVAGGLFAAAFVLAPGHGSLSWRARPVHTHLLPLLAGLCFAAPQLAFAAGTLGGVRAFRRRRAAVLSRREALVLVRRASVGLVAGLLAMFGLALVAVSVQGRAAGWWAPLALAFAGLGTLALVAAMPVVIAATRVKPAHGGASGDLDDGVGHFDAARSTGRAWPLAALFGAGVGFAVCLGGVVQPGPYDGVLRAVTVALACLGGLALLGRYLGLRSA